MSAASTHAAYMRGADKLNRLRPGSATAVRSRPMSANLEGVARRYGSSPVPETYGWEHAELNRPPQTVVARTAPSREASPMPERLIESKPQSPPRGHSRGNSPLKNSASNHSPIQAAIAAPSPPSSSRPSNSRPVTAGASRPPMMKPVGSLDSVHQHVASATRGRRSPSPVFVGDDDGASQPNTSRPATRMAAVWVPEDAKHEFTVEELQAFVVAARLEQDDENPNMPPLEQDPIAQKLRGSELVEPKSTAVVASWRWILGNSCLDLLRRRLAALCGLSRAHAVTIMNELEAIAVAVSSGSLNRDRLSYATRHSAHEAILSALRESVGAEGWTSEMEEGWEELLPLLSKS